jgi:anti-sigma factor RsiW
MDCRKFHRNLEDYLQGGLDFTGRFGMERHARQCFGCGKDVADAQKLGQMARELGKVQAPDNFEAAVLARIQSRNATRRRFRMPWIYRWEWLSWRSLAVGAAAAGVILVGVLIPLRQQKSPSIADPAVTAGDPPETPVAEAQQPAVRRPSGRTSGSPLAVSPRRIPPLTTEDASAPIDAEPGDEAGFVEYMVPGPGDRPVIMRLPRSVRMRYGPPTEEYFIRNVSH